MAENSKIVLPCPFCSEQPSFTDVELMDGRRYAEKQLRCCSITMSETLSFGQYKGLVDAQIDHTLRSKLVEAWNTRFPSPYSGAAELAAKIANSEASCFMLDAQQKQIVVAVLNAAANQSDGQGVRQEDTARFHGESLQQGPDTSSNPSTAATMSHGKGSGAASVAKPAAVSDRASHTATGPSDLSRAERAFSQCEKCWQPATCKKYGCRFPSTYSGAAGEVVALAFKPFIDFMAGSTFEKLPDNFEITHGSSLARKQITVGNLRALKAAIENETDNRIAARKADKSPSRTAVAEDALPSEGMPPSDGGHHLPTHDAERETIERCATAALEQRCERGTPWDKACVTIAEAIRNLSPSIPSREGPDRLWCTACGTVTRDLTCDCNFWNDPTIDSEPRFVNYADAMQEAAYEKAQRVATLESALSAADEMLNTLGLFPDSDTRTTIRNALSPSPTSVMPDEGKQK